MESIPFSVPYCPRFRLIVYNNTPSACILFAPVKRLRQKCEHYINCQVSTIMHFPAGVGSAVVGGATPRNKTGLKMSSLGHCTMGFCRVHCRICVRNNYIDSQLADSHIDARRKRLSGCQLFCFIQFMLFDQII